MLESARVGIPAVINSPDGELAQDTALAQIVLSQKPGETAENGLKISIGGASTLNLKGRRTYTEVQANTNEDSSELVLQHIGLVHRVANHLKARLPDHVELDELVQIGMLGLLEATKNFDSAQGVELSTFASKRIRGAILDEIRRRSPLSRSDNASVKSEQDAIEKLSHLHSEGTLRIGNC